jgi:HAD superfamily hydrolase (TIGR01549 family)
VRDRFQRGRNFSRAGLWKEVYGSFGREVAMDALRRMEMEYWETVQRWTRPFAETDRVLSELAGRYKLAVVSNTQGQLDQTGHRIAEFPEIGRHFETVVIAGESGIPPKPDPRPFLVCLERLELGSDEVVFVGDDWSIDIEGATNVGIRAVWLKHRSVKRSWPEVTTSVPVIESLDELLGLDRVLGESHRATASVEAITEGEPS